MAVPIPLKMETLYEITHKRFGTFKAELDEIDDHLERVCLVIKEGKCDGYGPDQRRTILRQNAIFTEIPKGSKPL